MLTGSPWAEASLIALSAQLEAARPWAERRPAALAASGRGAPVAVRHGCLVLADISGYTLYLSGVELDHSQDVLADLLGVVTEQLAAVGPLAKLEGDAVFVVGDGERVDGQALLAALDAAYAAFAVRRRTIELRTTCACDACSRIGGLDLKVIAHHGEFAEHTVAGSPEVVGPDVVVAHRLLKNEIAATTGVEAWAFLTDGCVGAGGLDPGELDVIAHTETYEDAGEVTGWVRDLGARWREMERREPVCLSAEDAYVVVGGLCPAPPPRVWEAITEPEQIVRWKEGATGVEMRDPQGGRGVGSAIHCVHGRQAFDQEVLDWRPFEYFSYRETGPYGPFMWTLALHDRGDATMVEMRVLRLGGPRQAAMMLIAKRTLLAVLRRSLDRLAALVASESDPPVAAGHASGRAV
jgi:uncharacterized protein YndB with AHSA1/START domain